LYKGLPFVTRTSIRPDLIAVTSVKVLGREDDVVRVRGLDAFNGSPILDLKPA
jgi:tRNA (Thr-GGU) A37 N-methylase